MKLEILGKIFDQEHLFETIMSKSDVLKKGRSVLQIGGRPGTGWVKIFQGFQKYGYNKFDLLEIHKPNYDWLVKQSLFKCNPHLGDIRLIDQYKQLDDIYDIIIFWHGWEHCTKAQTIEALPKVLNKCNIAHIAGMPWGTWRQADIKNNPHEKHVHHWLPEELEKLGFDECYCFNSGAHGLGPGKHNVMYAIKYKVK